MSKLPEQAERQLYVNDPQLRALAIDAATQMHVWGRRTGKTEGPGGMYTAKRVHDMPRGNGIFVGTTYEQLLTRTIPPLVASWAKLGYYQDVHYWIRKAPPAKLRIPNAYRVPLKRENYITWYNGSGIYLVSQDRPGSINGVASQWLYGDEAKFLNKDRLDEEVRPTLTGCRDLFGELPHYLSTCFLSDMPTSNKGSWMFDYEPQMDGEACELVYQLVLEESRLLQGLQLPGLATGKARRARRELARVQAAIAELRRDLVHYSEASTLDNVHVLGVDAIKRMHRDLPRSVFQSSVLNRRVVQVEYGFYGSLDEDKHGYHAHNYSHIDQAELTYTGGDVKDCRWDSDVDPKRPLEIGLDYNNIFNCLCVGQPRRDGREVRLLNSLFVEHPLLLQDVVAKFCDYYQAHPTKHVRYYYDHTAVARNAGSNASYADLVCQGLQARGWTVDRVYLGQASLHYARFLLWGSLLRETNPKLPVFRYNLDNARQWQISAQGAKTKRVGNEWKKDKDGEKVVKGKPVMPPAEATHLSEAADMLICGMVSNKMGKGVAEFIDTVIG